MCVLFCPSLYCIVLSFSSFSGVRTYLVRATAMLLVLSRSNDTGWYTTGRYNTAPFAYRYCGARVTLFSSTQRFIVACFVTTG